MIERLARPLRVGDMAFDSRNDKARRVEKIDNYQGGSVYLGRDDAMWCDAIGACRHEDGAPVDVGRTVAPPYDEEQHRHCDALIKDFRDLAAKLRDEIGGMRAIETSLTTRLEGERTRANRYGDANGELKTQNTELLAENATLRRRLEALERKGKR